MMHICWSVNGGVMHGIHKVEIKTINVYYIPTYAQINSVNFILITPICFGVNTPSVYLAPHTHTHLTRKYICGHIYQDFVITTYYYEGCLTVHLPHEIM